MINLIVQDNMNNFHYALSLCQTMYGIDLTEDQFEEIAWIAWQQIGNKRTRIYRHKVCMDDCATSSIELPCNCDLIEAVTTSWEDWGNVTNDTPNGDAFSGVTEQYIENRKRFHDHLYQSGKFIKYERVGDTLYFDKPYRQINILYRGIELDDEGLPELTDSEALAIATYCAYITKYKEGLITNNTNIISISNTLQQKWQIQCDQARTDQYLSQNEWDDILDSKTNWNRKVHNKSLKLYE